MRLPLWAIVLVACVLAPWVVRAWVDAERRRAKAKTDRVLQRIGKGASESGARRAASSDANNPSDGIVQATSSSREGVLDRDADPTP